MALAGIDHSPESPQIEQIFASAEIVLTHLLTLFLVPREGWFDSDSVRGLLAVHSKLFCDGDQRDQLANRQVATRARRGMLFTRLDQAHPILCGLHHHHVRVCVLGTHRGLKRRSDVQRYGPKQIGQLLRQDRFAE